MQDLLLALGKLVLFAVVGGIIMGIALAVFLRIFERLTPINEWEELKKGNMAVAVYVATAVLALSIVMAALLWPTERKILSDPLEIKLVAPEQDLEPAPVPRD
jgi:uncharacterized membrane protein YjfL (UPF0719 family)